MKLRNSLLDEFLTEDEETVEGQVVVKEEKPIKVQDLDEITKYIAKEVNDCFARTKIEIDKTGVEALNQIVARQVKNLKDEIVRNVREELHITRHVIELPNLPAYETNHPVHKAFDDVMTMLLAGFNVYMYGEAGTGKTQIAEDIASALNLEMYNLTSGDMVGIYGYCDINGKFHETPFTKAFQNGGVLYISEFDSIDSQIALTINTAIANGITTINDKTVHKHKDFYVLCDGNTRGNGASFSYSARGQLDASTINRFLYIEIDYDKNIELYLSRQNAELVNFIEKFRATCERNEIQCLATYRAIQAISTLEEKLGIEKALEFALLKGMNKDDLASIKTGITMAKENKYLQALKLVGER